MVEVRFWETVSQRRQEEPAEVFNIDITPAKVPAGSKKKATEAILDCKCAAINKVREIVGYNGVLVANIIKEEN